MLLPDFLYGADFVYAARLSSAKPTGRGAVDPDFIQSHGGCVAKFFAELSSKESDRAEVQKNTKNIKLSLDKTCYADI
ncbi:MAG: hypothetical protein ACI4QR_04645 [Eubacteriales bacterium]